MPTVLSEGSHRDQASSGSGPSVGRSRADRYRAGRELDPADPARQRAAIGRVPGPARSRRRPAVDGAGRDEQRGPRLRWPRGRHLPDLPHLRRADRRRQDRCAQTDTFHGRFVRLVPDAEVVQEVEFETDDPAMQGAMTITYSLSDAPAAARPSRASTRACRPASRRRTTSSGGRCRWASSPTSSNPVVGRCRRLPNVEATHPGRQSDAIGQIDQSLRLCVKPRGRPGRAKGKLAQARQP